jgi:inorganic triphosphatase YgiF
MKHEIELKLTLTRKALPALRRHPIFAGAERLGTAVTLENTYFDTPELALQARKVALRTRRQGRNCLQTVKCGAQSTGGLSERPEWEQRFDGVFDFTSIDAPKVAKLLRRHEPQVVPIFTTRFRRETRRHSPEQGVRILMMLDCGTVIAGEHEEPICELELELEQGHPLDLLVLAGQLVADLPLMPADVSKAERGYRLRLGVAPAPQRAEAPPIDADQTPVEAFRDLAFSCLRQWQANAPGAIGGVDPEFVHQLRVSQRRLRLLLDLFAPALPDAFVTEWRARLRDNASAFGSVRDLDVLYDEIVAPAAAPHAEDQAALAQLQQRVGAMRDAARAEVVTALDAGAQGRLLIGLMAALYALPTNNLIGAADLRTFARLQLKRLRKKVRRQYAAARTLQPAPLHALRIALKHLRYSVEFFAPLMPAKTASRQLKALTRAQGALGFINDMDVARTPLAACAGEDVALRAAAAFVRGWHGPEYMRLRRRAMRELEVLLGDKSPWCE